MVRIHTCPFKIYIKGITNVWILKMGKWQLYYFKKITNAFFTDRVKMYPMLIVYNKLFQCSLPQQTDWLEIMEVTEHHIWMALMWGILCQWHLKSIWDGLRHQCWKHPMNIPGGVNACGKHFIANKTLSVVEYVDDVGRWRDDNLAREGRALSSIRSEKEN